MESGVSVSSVYRGESPSDSDEAYALSLDSADDLVDETSTRMESGTLP